jgi:hypothetical protein
VKAMQAEHQVNNYKTAIDTITILLPLFFEDHSKEAKKTGWQA